MGDASQPEMRDKWSLHLPSFDYGDAARVANVEKHLGVDRFYKYAQYTDFVRLRAFELYAWNAASAAAFYLPLQGLEVGLRNAMERQLVAAFGVAWYDNSQLLGTDSLGRLAKKISEAKNALARRKPPCPVSSPQLVTELSFGFWTYLLSKKFEHVLWVPCLRNAFPFYVSAPGTSLPLYLLQRELRYLKAFRDRIAHHEPVFYRALSLDYRSILTVCTWMYEDLADWIDHHCQTKSFVATRPKLGPLP
jgi:hypothetical protein